MVKGCTEVGREKSNTLCRTRDLTQHTHMKLDKEKGIRQNILIRGVKTVRLLNNVGKSGKVIDTVFKHDGSNESNFVIDAIFRFSNFISL